MRGCAELSRRTLLAGGLALLPLAQAWAQAPGASKRRIAFDVWRNDQLIGGHSVDIEGDETDTKVRTHVNLLVKFGPIPVFRYAFQSHETWRDGKFSSLESHSETNGRADQIHAVSGAAGVTIQSARGQTHTAPADALPLSHWNQHALRNPLFNPQTGAMLKEHVARREGETLRLPDGRSIQTTKVTLVGDIEIIDWYDETGAWVALRGRLKDGSYLDYRLTA
jgi:hypothetical protein